MTKSLLSAVLLVILPLLAGCPDSGSGLGSTDSVARAWSTAQLIEASTENADVPDVAINSSGDAMTVWVQYDGTRNNAWVNRYVAATNTWETPELIEAATEDASGVHVAMDAGGNAVAIWGQYDGTQTNLWAKRYVAATNTWGSAQLIEANPGSIGNVDIVVDSSGNAVVVWNQFDGIRYNIWANRYVAATNSWGTAQLIETGNAGDASFPQVAVDGSGNAIAVWSQTDGSLYNTMANRYDEATDTWGTEELVETNPGQADGEPSVAVDSSGNAVVVWSQYDGTRYNIWASRHVAGIGSWATAQLLETDNTGDANDPKVVVDTNGNAVVVWNQYDGTRQSIWANHYVAGTNSWATAQLIETDSSGGAGLQRIGVDGSGNALVVWKQHDGARDNMWANRYVAATTSWDTAQLIETDNTGGVDFPQVAVSTNGSAVAVWSQFDGTTTNIIVNNYR